MKKRFTAKKLLRRIMIMTILAASTVVLTACASKKPSWNYTWEDNGDMEVVRERMVSDLYDAETDPSLRLADLRSDGSFGSIKYDTDAKDTWHPAKHLDFILDMQKAAYSEGNPFFENAELISGIDRAINYWVQKDYFCDWNGWWNGLGVGPKIADILLFPNEGLDSVAIDKLTEKLYSITCFEEKKRFGVKEREIDSTGGNLTDVVNHSLKYAVIKRDGGAIKFLRRLMENELRPFPAKKLFSHRYDAEGIKADMSFQQHFETLYFGGYGEVFTDGMNKFIRYTSKTQFEMSDKSLNFYQDFLLDGMQYATRGGYRDLNASGRGIVRKDMLKGIYSQVKNGCETLLASGAELTRADELNAFLSNRNAENDIGAGGHKYFWNSDYQVYNDKNYMASVRSASKRTKNNEALNGENVWGHYLGAGATAFYLRGDEYFNIAPIMNWNRVSGTTTVQGYLPKGGDETYTRMGKTSFVGGVSDGRVGMSCMDYRDNGVKAKKAWFMFEDGAVCLGADVSASKSGELFTCINQTLLRGDVIFRAGGARRSVGEIDASENAEWVYHNGIGYVTNDRVSLKAGLRTGDWKTVSERVESENYSDGVFEIGLSHGSKPKNAGYEYTVLMNVTPDALDVYSAAPTLITVRNDDKCQAVYDRKTGTFSAVFWKSGSVELPDGTKIEVNAGCNILYRGGEAAELYASDPLQNGGKLKIKVNGETHAARFEKGMYAGKTVKII